jgi:EmrB/QacA subfamily drug resistance transporter
MSRRTQVTLIVLSGVFLSSLDMFIVNIAFPDISRDFEGTSLASLSWILSAYAIVFAALLVPAGRWADRAGRKRAFLGGLALFTLASAICAAAPSVEVLVAARALQAAGAALMLPTSLALLLPEFPPERRAAAVALWAAVGGLAAAAGPPIGGLLVEASWRWVFLVNLPVTVFALVAGARVLREVRDPVGSRPDVAGAVLLAAGIAALTAAIVQGPEWGWGGSRVLGLLVAAAVLVAGVAWRSRTHPAPIVEPDLVRRRTTALANAAALIYFAAFAAGLLAAVLFLTSVWHESVLTAGLMIAPGPVMAAVFAVPGGLLGERYGQHVVGAVGAVLFGGAVAWWVSVMGATPDYAGAFLPTWMLGGVGVGLALPSLSAAATAALPATRFATGTALFAMSRQIGSALGIAILVAIVGTPAPDEAVAAYGHGWTFVSVAMLASAAVLLAIGPAPARVASPIPATEGAAA